MNQPDQHIAAIRTDYRLAALDESMVGPDPLLFFQQWFREAEQAHIHEVNAMTLATTDTEGQPHARIVLLKGIDERGFVFFTNYESAKGKQLLGNPKAALVFFWKELERQVRIEGTIEQISGDESDTYFQSRPAGSRIGAWASPQSQPVADRALLEAKVDELTQKYKDGSVPRPPYWGGYRIRPVYLEFWQGRASRLHDRIVFRQDAAGKWDISRLAP